MSQAAAQATAFFREVAVHHTIWTVREESGFPFPLNSEGRRAAPFWSSESRARRVIAQVPAYAGFTVVALTWEEVRDRWLPGLERDGFLVGINWTGERATGYDLEPRTVLERMEQALQVACEGTPEA